MERYKKWSIWLRYAFYFGCGFNLIFLLVNLACGTADNLLVMLWTVALTGLCFYESKAMMRTYLENPDAQIEEEGMFEASLRYLRQERQEQRQKGTGAPKSHDSDRF